MPSLSELLGSTAPPPSSEPPPEPDDSLMTRAEVADFYRVSVPTMERWSLLGIGPRPVKLPGGSVRYWRSEVIATAQGARAA